VALNASLLTTHITDDPLMYYKQTKNCVHVTRCKQPPNYTGRNIKYNAITSARVVRIKLIEGTALVFLNTIYNFKI
jgi:hypothetical protein